MAAIRKGPRSITKVTRRTSQTPQIDRLNLRPNLHDPTAGRTPNVLLSCSPCLPLRLTRGLRSSRFTKKVSIINSPPAK